VSESDLQSTDELVEDKTKTERVSLQLDVMREIRRYLAPYLGGEKPVSGNTVISDGVTIDSLTVMDLIMDLEDRFAVCLPMRAMVNIRTVDQLAQTVLTLRARA
jgi:acyl carrier protein